MIDQRIIQGAKCELARRSFFEYCHLRTPEFYKKDRDYLVTLCNTFQEFIESKDEILVVNAPPRHGKSFTEQHFAPWVFGKNPTARIMTGSYNEILSTTFSKSVRNSIQEVKTSPDKLVYSDIFPNVKIQYGDAAAKLWALEGQYSSYLATSPTGTATGFGCSLMIIDDLIKSSLEANNENTLGAHWDWFTNTMLSRLEQGGKIIIVMTRWATKDLAGRVISYYKQAGKPIRVVTMKALQDDGTMLCDDILSREAYENKIMIMGADIASANYQQIPIDIKGRLYTSFKTYGAIPTQPNGRPLFTKIRNYTDTADEGSDSLCSITYGEYNHEAYVLDVYFTKAGMEVTEEETAKRLFENNCNVARIESNNGGRGFARNVQRYLKDKFKSNRCAIEWFHQSENKQARILTNSTWICNHVYYPVNWRDKWPEYYMAMNEYQREGKNAHDDAPDATTGVAEQLNTPKTGVTIGGW